MSSFIPYLVVLLLLSPVTIAAQTPPPQDDPGEEGCPEARIHDYLDRHGDHGRIDPELMLDLSRRFKESMEANRFYPSAIAGEAWKPIGPSNGAGRATSLALHPSITGTAIIGAAGGGAWKTTDGGVSWRALTDDIPNLSVGAVAYAPSDPNIVYLGTGEGGYAGDFIPGIGLLLSVDGGESWILPGTVAATQFYRLLVSPSNSQEILAATNNGLLRSTGGQNGPWTTVIPSTPPLLGTGYGDVTDLVRDPTEPRRLYATTWDRRLWCARSLTTCSPTLKFESPTVMKSADGGATWQRAGEGLPVSSPNIRVNRMAIAIAPSAPSTLYVATSIFENDTGREISRIYRSTDSAETWTETGLSSVTQGSLNTYLGTQAWYDNTIVVSPTDPNSVTAGGVIYVRTADGGNTWNRILTSVHVDAHEMRYDATGLLWIANDGGIWTSDPNGQATDRNRGLITRQFYDLANDPVNRNRVYGGQQDNGTVYRPDGGGTSWSFLSGGDGFACAVVPTAPSIAFSTIQNGLVLRTMTAGSLYRSANRSPRYDKDETTPFYSIVQVDPQTPSTIYAASYRVWKSVSAGDGWTPLPTTLDGAVVWPADATVRCMAIARRDPRVMMVATASPRRKVYRSTNGGTSWTDVTGNLPSGRTILHIDIDPGDTRNVAVALAGTSGSSVYTTASGGSNWEARSSGLPPFSAQTVRFDPNDSSTLYAGTDVGVYRSTDRGLSWSRFGTGMPAVSVYDVDPTNDGSILRAATHGRGIWELTIPRGANQPPGVVISAPMSSTISVARGATVTFSGFINDIDDTEIAASWTFSDSWSSVPARNGESVRHRFDRAGRHVVGLSATDPAGGIGSATVEVDVLDPNDSCATPTDIPGSGPFPYSATVNTDLATKETSDPRSTASCYPFAAQTSSWFTFTPVTSGEYQFSLCGSEVSAVLIGDTGSSCGTLNSSRLCISRSSATADCASSSSTQSLVMQAGETMRMYVTNYFSNDFGNVTVTVTQNSLLSPVVSTVAPATALPGTAIVVNGLGFQAGAAVELGGVRAREVSVISPTSIVATTPQNMPLTVNVVVINPDGTNATLKDGFTFQAAPSVAKRRVVRR